MTNEMMLQVISEYLENGDTKIIVKTKEKLIEDIRKEQSLKKGNTVKDETLVKRLMKSAADINSKLAAGYSTYNNKYAFIDGYRLYILSNDFGYPLLKDKMQEQSIKQILGDSYNYTITSKIDMKELKAFHAVAKAEKKIKEHLFEVAREDDTIQYFNSEFLLEILTLYKTDTIYCKENLCDTVVTSTDFSGELGLLLPCRKPKNK